VHSEINADDFRALCMQVKERGAPATAVHVRDIVKQIYVYANLHGEKVANPADNFGAASIATFVPKNRALSPIEIRLMHRRLDQVATYPTTRLALRLILLTLLRKSELIEATWDEVDFEAAVWTIPRSRMKARKAHNVYLSRQALDIMVALHTCAAGSKYVLPSRYDADRSRIDSVPETHVYIVPSDAPPGGVGEPGVPPTSAAIRNAIFDATGKRIRALPVDTGLLKRVVPVCGACTGAVLLPGPSVQSRVGSYVRCVSSLPIAFIHQDLGLIHWMTVLENVCLTRGFACVGGLVSWKAG
jgi:hypothetical protein